VAGRFCATHQKRGQPLNPLQSWATAPTENEKTKMAVAGILAEEIINGLPSQSDVATIRCSGQNVKFCTARDFVAVDVQNAWDPNKRLIQKTDLPN
jgi:hypothetical protein